MVIQHGKLLYTEIVINAPVAKVWNILADFAAYPQWNPFIVSVSGTAVAGGHITNHMRMANGKTMVFSPKVLRMEPGRELRWIGSMGMPYIFDGEHVFELTANSDGTTTLSQYEFFRGILVPFMKRMLDEDTKNNFMLMNTRLKERAESAA